MRCVHALPGLQSLLIVFLLLANVGALAQISTQTLAVIAEGVPTPLTSQPGDPGRGKDIVADRQSSLCLLCHAAPIEPARFQGNLGPDLRGAGLRLTPAQLRLRLIDSRAINPQTLMPAYFELTGLNRVGQAWRGKPIFSAQQIEDVVAYLSELRE